MDHNHHQLHLWLGSVGASGSGLVAMATSQPAWVPLTCALIAASVPLTSNAVNAWRAWRAHKSAPALAEVIRLRSEIEHLRSRLAAMESE